jgi:hypothetical protein
MSLENALLEGLSMEWEEKGMCGDYYKMVHVPCGRQIMVLAGYEPICSGCHPEKWAEQKRLEGF